MLAKSFIAAAALSSIALAQPGVPRPFEGHQVVRTSVQSLQQLRVVTEMADNIWSCTYGVGTPIDMQVAPDRAAALRAWAAENNLPYEVKVQDVQAWVDAEHAAIEQAHRERSVDWYAVYRNPTEINAKLDEFAAAYPGMAQLFTVGQSIENRPIRGVSISAPDQPGNPRSGRIQIVFNSAQHAREWLTPMTSMFIAEELLSKAGTDARIRGVLDRVEFFIVPVVNVDGYAFTWATGGNRFWRKNRRVNAGTGNMGVDTNRNWGHQWGSNNGSSGNPASDTYRGLAAFSEPEPAAMRDLMNSLPRLAAYIDIHSYGNLLMYPWGYTFQPCVDDAFLSAVSRSMVDGFQYATGTSYLFGPVYTSIYPVSGGALDWGYGSRGVASWTIEVPGGRFDPSPSFILPTAIENFEAILRLGEWMGWPSKRYLDVQPMARWIGPGASALAAVSVRTTFGPIANAPKMYSRNGGAFAPVSMTSDGANRYTAAAYTGACGQGVEYYFEAMRSDGSIVRSPDDAPAAFHTTGVADSIITFSDDMEVDRGWTVGAATDTATSGVWVRASPIYRSLFPIYDATPDPGTRCWVTGATVGPSSGHQVDGGETTLTSPRFSAVTPLSNVADAQVSFMLWYANDRGETRFNDSLSVLISGDDGASWALLDRVGNSAHAWVTKTYSLGAIGLLTPTMRLRLVASDLGLNDDVAAGLDDFSVTVFACRRNPDFNTDGGVDGSDVEAFFRAWEAGEARADFNADGGVDGGDIAAFFEAWEAG